jgi:hypothetical protein
MTNICYICNILYNAHTQTRSFTDKQISNKNNVAFFFCFFTIVFN